MGNILTKEKINVGRQKEFDVAKGLAIIFMVLVHVCEVYLDPALEGGLFNEIVEFLGSPTAAPVFMFLLGVGIVYSRKNNTSEILFKRGIKLLCLGYILNFVRDFIPCMILAGRYDDIEYAAEAWNSLFGIDILMFAGLTFMFFAFIKKFRIKDKFLIVFWCFFASLALILKDVSFDSELLNSAFGLIWGTNDYSWFPFLNWIFYPILGYLFAQVIIRCRDKEKFYKNIFIVSTALSLPLWIGAYFNDIRFGAFGNLYQNEYYNHDIMGNIILGTFVLMWISILFFTTKYIPQSINEYFMRWSKNCNSIYCVHWILLGFSMLILNEESYMIIQLFIITISIFLLTDMISYFMHKKNIIQYKFKYTCNNTINDKNINKNTKKLKLTVK